MSSVLKKLKEFLAMDKRKTERLTLPAKVSFRRVRSNKWQTPVSIDNISGGGMRFKSTERLKSNSFILIKMKFPEESEIISITGKVLRCKEVFPSKTKKTQQIFSTGVKFNKIDSETKRRFVRYFCGKILTEYLDDNGTLLKF